MTYTCNTFTGFHPVGVAAVVEANSAAAAAQWLNQRLQLMGLPGDAKPEDMKAFPNSPGENVRVLCDGDY